MNRREKFAKMEEYCEKLTSCSECRVDRKNPEHNCGFGRGYSLCHPISDEELEENYKIIFEYDELNEPKLCLLDYTNSELLDEIKRRMEK